jgi:methionine biosynthesis protein MetW
VLQIDTLQHLKNAETMLTETTRVGKVGLITFPNFAHWPNRISVLNGRMPVTKHLPYQWYNTPNIRVATFEDFYQLATKNNLRVEDAFGIQNDVKIKYLMNLRASKAVFKVTNR